MKPIKPIFLKTYGKQRRKVSAWISSENRQEAFDTTASTDGDISVFEPTKPTRIRERKASVASCRAGRPAKKKAILCLIERSFDEENVPPPPRPLPAQQSKTTREKKTHSSNGRAVRPAKRKAMLCQTGNSSDEENSRPSPPRRQTVQQSKTTRKSRLVCVPGVSMGQRGQHLPRTSESEEDSVSTAKCQEKLVQVKTDSNLRLTSAGRFVTRRRRAGGAKPKLPQATFSVLNSSDDFTSGALGSSKIHRPPRRRKIPPTFRAPSVENSVNAAGTSSFDPFREISLSESADHSLGTCSRKPIFCSTPSAGPVSKRPHLNPLSINDQSATPPSISVSCIGVMSTFQEDNDSLGQPFSPPFSAPPIGLHSEEKPQSSLGEQEPSDDLFMETKNTNKKSSCSKEAKSRNEGIKTRNVGELPSLNLLSTDDSESSSQFVSAAAGLEWLVEALKENCLSQRCTVQLERLDDLTVSQTCSQTTYSSCLGHSSSVHSWQLNEHPQSVGSIRAIDLSESSEPSFSLHLSVTNGQASGYLQSVNSFESLEHVAPGTDSQSTNNSPSVDLEHPAEHSSSEEPMEQSASVLNVESTHHTDSCDEFIMGTQLPANGPMQALFTAEQAVALKDKCPAKKCTVQLKKLTVQHLKGLMQQKEAGSDCDEKSSNPDANRSENDSTHNNPEDLTRSGEITESMMASMRRPVNPEKEEKAAEHRTMLKEKCQNDRVFVAVKRVTLSQLKDILLLSDRKLESPSDVSGSASDDHTKNHHQSESDTNHCNEGASAVKASKKKRGSTSSEDKISPDKDEAVKNVNVPHKRRKTSKAPREKKRRSTSVDRPGTTRKVCVSGLSVSRWKNKGSGDTHVFTSRTKQTGGIGAVDCSINELISTRRKQPRELMEAPMNFSTPVRPSRSSLLSLLADLTPNTHTWSRLKAALSVHRKGVVLHTPRSGSGVRASHPHSRLLVSGTPGRAELTDDSQDLFATPDRTLLYKRCLSQLQSCESLVECEDADLSDAEKVYAECGQQRPLPWEECILPQRMKQCAKIGEGTFGEVFSTTNVSGDTVALKIIPIEGSEKVNGEDQKTFGEILHEIIISKELSRLTDKQQNQTHGFIGLNDLHCVRGCYPPDFLNAWDAFDQQKGSENDRPDFFEKDQLFIILEFEFGGIDLENSSGTLTSLGVAKSILHQVTAALAVAEQELHFEHRDLHWGNVLVKTTKQKKGSFLLNGAAHSVETRGVLVRIIDYSLSRLEIDDLTVSCDISKDEELFMGQGDYQFDIYRLMRQENGNNWSTYHPHTNVLWLHYLCSKLLSMKYRCSGGRGAKDIREELTRFYDNVLQYSSATEALQNCPMFQ
ncbi:serine-rich adhesin for platelets [Chaetodon trifascialis]|uniref:serine-rich adhesin for platelets n=1 Tax=Chaetodon trifascialis TaxID=109706 RepID=UPI003996C74C